ncbi:MAG: bifunctional precorrin-2 dehydrogenase/sirohydrochlorin ferrochelatase [Candidatus Bathyarchaeota archaeon]|nr:bifunctional precorrin-2 dehydrogenase/sirohydrochlorin ferrochelatase [Candidatus Bathyarchaeota archaeon]
MIIDYKFYGKYVVIVGGGAEAYRKVLNFLDDGAKILVASRSFTNDIERLCEEKKICLLKVDIKDSEVFFAQLNPKPDVLAVATDDPTLNVQLAKLARAAGCMVYVADNPAISDFILPAVARIGDMRVAISTKGQSPAMAKILRQKIEKIITAEEMQQIKLQAHIRAMLKQQILDQKLRKKIIYEILGDEKVNTLLKEGKLDEAQNLAQQIIKSYQAKREEKRLWASPESG